MIAAVIVTANSALRRSVVWVGLAVFVGLLASAGETAAGWKAGLAKIEITPETPMRMSGYASRDHAAEGKETDLWAKSVLLEDEKGHRALAISLDLVGIDGKTSKLLKERIGKDLGLQPGEISLLCSHTHCGPIVGHNLLSMYALTEEEHAQIRTYTAGLVDRIVKVASMAAADLKPADISYGSGTASFAVNRRTNKEPEVPAQREKFALLGPSDHAVPVLRIVTDGKLRGVVFGYACHATTLSYYQWCGDYPGFAMMEIEAAHLGAVALFWAGCGADQNPLPRRTVELAKSYGHQLAAATEGVLQSAMKPIAGELSVQYDEIPLGFAHIPGREELESLKKSPNRYEAARATYLLSILEKEGKLATEYPYPIQTWKLGGGPQWVMLGGEVVVDYSLRVKKENAGEPVWVAGYANDVMAYIPSVRVLKEGGYEGRDSMVYYGHPSAWNEEVEERIIKGVTRLLSAGRP